MFKHGVELLKAPRDVLNAPLGGLKAFLGHLSIPLGHLNVQQVCFPISPIFKQFSMSFLTLFMQLSFQNFLPIKHAYLLRIE